MKAYPIKIDTHNLIGGAGGALDSYTNPKLNFRCQVILVLQETQRKLLWTLLLINLQQDLSLRMQLMLSLVKEMVELEASLRGKGGANKREMLIAYQGAPH